MRILLPSALRDHLGGLPEGVEPAWYAGYEECRAAVADAEVLWLDFFGRRQIESVLREGARLRWVFSRGAGMDRQPLEAYRERGIVLTNGSGLAAGPISESLVLAMLAAAKRFPDLVRAQDRAEWLPRPPGLGELHGSRALVLGYGEIGRAAAARLTGFGVEVVGVRRRPAEDPAVIGPGEWRRRLPEFDWVLVTVASTEANRRLVGAAELAAMKPGAWILNVTRGWIVDQAALLDALRAGRLGGAYLDVTDPEPLPADSELWRLPNVIITPHSSWASARFAERSAALFLDNLGRYLAGTALRNRVDLEAGY
jgi:phosphoglycerate dehydrogenase-like enzyme